MVCVLPDLFRPGRHSWSSPLQRVGLAVVTQLEVPALGPDQGRALPHWALRSAQGEAGPACLSA